jgi:hypothetical protein
VKWSGNREVRLSALVLLISWGLVFCATWGVTCRPRASCHEAFGVVSLVRPHRDLLPPRNLLQQPQSTVPLGGAGGLHYFGSYNQPVAIFDQ